jgi:hypothetical protein
MAINQCGLCDFAQVNNVEHTTVVNSSPKQPAFNRPIYRTTEEILNLLCMEHRFPLDKARKSNSGFYQCEHYLVSYVGRNKWELFERC